MRLLFYAPLIPFHFLPLHGKITADHFPRICPELLCEASASDYQETAAYVGTFHVPLGRPRKE